jgi:trehalose/maltose hydrolase-like predicted phosphorylase
MTNDPTSAPASTATAGAPLPEVLAETTFEAVVFDWDGTAVADRAADATAVRDRVEALSAAGMHVAVVSGTHVGNIDGQLAARPQGPGRLHLCLNGGSEVFEVTGDGPALAWRRTATPDEDRALDRAAALTVERLRAAGLEARVVDMPPAPPAARAGPLNRRKIDLIPEPAWADPPRARIGELVDAVGHRLAATGLAGLAEVVAISGDAARAAGLTEPRITGDVKHVEIGLTDRSDSARWAAGWLSERGITGGLVLVVGDEFGPLGGLTGSDSLMLVAELARAPAVSIGVEPNGCPERVLHIGGGPSRFLEILDAQLARRRDHRVPSIDADPAWLVCLPTDPHDERVAEAVGALANGWVGTRATLEEHGPSALPLLAVNAMYMAGPSPGLLAGPQWDRLAITPADHEASDTAGRARTERMVDLRTAVLVRRDDTGLRTFRFVSAARPEALALRAEGPVAGLQSGPGLTPPDAATSGFERRRRHGADLARVYTPGDGGIIVAARDEARVTHDRRVVERLAAWTADRSRVPAWSEAQRALEELGGTGFDRLLAEHREAWAERWADAEVRIEGSPGDELAARFAVFHLLAAVPDAGEAAVGARGLTGRAYGGHVFWDADVFVLPVLAALRPAAARAMVEYRLRRLPAARAAAARRGRRGARFPWESATDGSDVTPTQAPGRHGELVPILTGEEQEHIVGDVAWAACRYAAWTDDTAFLEGPGQPLLVETARWWATGIRQDATGCAHIDAVMGPDEYHPVVDDNAYTNVLARWNLRRAADLVDATGGDRDEAAEWRRLADMLVDGFDAERGLHEQFAGYGDLEPLLATQVATPPFAADLLLGAERVAGSQLIKQADVVMAHHILPGEMASGSLAADVAYYEPRTVHGSSLSPAIYAAQLARARRPDDALGLFRLAVRLDLDDLTGTTAGGLHLATLGGVWQALAHGFLGLDPAGEALGVDPCLPSPWQALELRFRFRGRAVGVRADRHHVRITCDAPLPVRLAAGPPRLCDPPATRISLEAPR